MWAAAIMGAIQLGLGVYQMVESGKKRPDEPTPPKDTISQGTRDTVGLAKTLLNGRSVAAKVAEGNIRTNQANQVSNIQNTATNSAQSLAAITATGAQTNANLTGLEAQEEALRNSRIQNYNQAQRAMTAEEKRVFEVNNILPYQQSMAKYDFERAEKSRLMESGIQNAYSGLGTAAQSFSYGDGNSGMNVNNILKKHGADSVADLDRTKLSAEELQYLGL